MEYFTAVTKAYETLYDDAKWADYDEESLSDKEFFTIWLAGIPINLYYVFFSLILVSGGLVVKKYFFDKWESACPIED